MKTARQVLEDHREKCSEYDRNLGSYNNMVTEAMQDYARQCAKQALKDAAETKQIDGVTPYFSHSEQLEITNTPIITP